MPWRLPPSISRGARRPPSRPLMRAPISRSGVTTRSIGRLLNDVSPATTVRHGNGAQNPASRRIVVPELPASTVVDAPRRLPPVTRTVPAGSPSTRAPRASTAPRVRPTSSPVERPVILDVPFARAASSRARWDIDLSPGTRRGSARRNPRRGRPVTVNVLTSRQSLGGRLVLPSQQGAAHEVGRRGVDEEDEDTA